MINFNSSLESPTNEMRLHPNEFTFHITVASNSGSTMEKESRTTEEISPDFAIVLGCCLQTTFKM